MTDYTLRVEYFAVNPPKPTGIGVFADGKVVAHLTAEQLREALERYDEMESSRTPARVIDNITELYVFASNGYVNTAKRGEANTTQTRHTAEVELAVGQRMIVERGKDVLMVEVLP